MHNHDWDIYRVVLALARCGTASAAAQELGVNHTTVLRRVAQYEERAGLKLFTRSMGGYVPTAEGRVAVEIAARMDDQVRGLSRRVLGSDVELEGTLTVTTTDTLMMSTLPTHLAAFQNEHPMVRLDIVVTHARLNILQRDADVAIRPTDALPDGLEGQWVAEFQFGSYRLAGREDLRRWVAPGPRMLSSTAATWFAEEMQEDGVALSVDSFAAIRSCAVAGIGRAILPCFLGEDDQRLERLKLFPNERSIGLWVMSHPELMESLIVRSFVEFLTEAMRADPSLQPIVEGDRHG